MVDPEPLPPGAVRVPPLSTLALEAADFAWAEAQDTTGPDVMRAVLEAAAPFIAADAVAMERRRVADKVQARIAEIAMGADWRTPQAWRHLTEYGRGCIHGLDHARYMAMNQPHKADPR